MTDFVYHPQDCMSPTGSLRGRGVARTGAWPPWQKTGPLLGKSFFKKLINFNKKISVQNWHIFSPLSQIRYLLIIIMCPVMSAKVGPLNILCGPSWAKILATPQEKFWLLTYGKEKNNLNKKHRKIQFLLKVQMGQFSPIEISTGILIGFF